MKTETQSKTNPTVLYVGIDVSKDTLAVDAGPSFKTTIPNDQPSLRAMVRTVRKAIAADCELRFAFEPTGAYSQPLQTNFAKLKQHCCLVHGNRVRHFAKAAGVEAKTDPVDARVIRLFAETMQAQPTPPPSEAMIALQQIVALRALLVKMQNMLATSATETVCRACRESVQALRNELDKQVEVLTKALTEGVRNDPEADRIRRVVEQIAGVGDVTAATVAVLAPELGTMDRRQAAALAGLAPIPRESGTFKGKRFIRGGRAALRRSLYMAALVAAYHNKVLRPFYDKLVQEKQKPKKVALVAVMRKLFLHMNTLVRNERIASRTPAAQDPVPSKT